MLRWPPIAGVSMDWKILMWGFSHIKDAWVFLRRRSDEEVWTHLWNVKKNDTLLSNPSPIISTGLLPATIAKNLHRSRESVLKSLKRLEFAGRVRESLNGWTAVKPPFPL